MCRTIEKPKVQGAKSRATTRNRNPIFPKMYEEPKSSGHGLLAGGEWLRSWQRRKQFLSCRKLWLWPWRRWLECSRGAGATAEGGTTSTERPDNEVVAVAMAMAEGMGATWVLGRSLSD